MYNGDKPIFAQLPGLATPAKIDVLTRPSRSTPGRTWVTLAIISDRENGMGAKVGVFFVESN